MTALLVVAIAAVPAGLLMAVLAVQAGTEQPTTVGVLENLQRSAYLDDRERELTLSFTDRVVRPALLRIGGLVARRRPAAQLEELERRITAAGGVWGLSAAGFMAIQFVLLVGGLVLGALVGVVVAPLGLGPFGIVLLGIAGAAAGSLVPRMKLSNALKRRQRDILRALPNALDLMTIGVEAGLSFDQALQQIVDKYHNDLTREFNIVLNEVRLGRPRRDVLRSFQERMELDELSTFIDAVVQSEQLGTPMAQTLRIQSEEIRRRFRQRAEEQGQKAPLKMLFPMVGCIFPTLFVVLLGPAAVTVYHSVVAH